MTDKMREEFEKIIKPAYEKTGTPFIENNELYNLLYSPFRLAYNLREQEVEGMQIVIDDQTATRLRMEQEVQRLREALRLIYEDSDNITSEGIADIAKQALQETTNK